MHAAMRLDKGEAATVAATAAEPMQRIEIVGERRRRHDASYRALVVAESLVSYVPGQEYKAVKVRLLGALPAVISDDRPHRAGDGAVDDG